MARKDITLEERLENLRNESKKSHNKRRRKRIAYRIKGTENEIRDKHRKKKHNPKKSGK